MAEAYVNRAQLEVRPRVGWLNLFRVLELQLRRLQLSCRKQPIALSFQCQHAPPSRVVIEGRNPAEANHSKCGQEAVINPKAKSDAGL